MGWDGIVIAEARFPPGGAQQWKEQVIEEETYSDWPQFIAGSADPTTVEAQLAEMDDPQSFLAVSEGPSAEKLVSRLEGERYSLRLWINEDDYRAREGNIATMLRLAERVPGAAVHAYFMASDGMDGVCMRVAKGKTTFSEFGYEGTSPKPQKGDLFDVDAELNSMFQAASEAFGLGTAPATPKAKAKRKPAKKPARKAAKKPTRRAKR